MDQKQLSLELDYQYKEKDSPDLENSMPHFYKNANAH
jgi:hypothetical protein